MKLVTVALCFGLFAFSTALDRCPEEKLSKCVSLRKCPSLLNKIEELRIPNGEKQLIEFLNFVKSNYFCGCAIEDHEPAVVCPEEDQKGLFQSKIQTEPIKQVNKDLKKKELLKECGISLENSVDLWIFLPWMAQLQFENLRTGEEECLCGGVLISDRYVLTSARCVTSPSYKLTNVRLDLGEYDLIGKDRYRPSRRQGKSCSRAGRILQVAESILHPGYNAGRSPRSAVSDDPSDLALVKLERTAKFDDLVYPICLPQRPHQPEQRFDVSGSSVTMAPDARGFHHQYSSMVYELTPEECVKHPVNRAYSRDDHICAGGQYGNACVADAGGPLTADEKKDDGSVRVTAFGVGFMELTCSKETSNVPGLFTRVHKYMPWIEEYIYQSDE